MSTIPAQVSNDIFTTPANCVKVGLSFKTTSLNTCQFEKGTSKTSFEPYTGEKPAPSPDYPQEINSISSLSLHLDKKNLLDQSILLTIPN